MTSKITPRSARPSHRPSARRSAFDADRIVDYGHDEFDQRDRLRSGHRCPAGDDEGGRGHPVHRHRPRRPGDAARPRPPALRRLRSVRGGSPVARRMDHVLEVDIDDQMAVTEPASGLRFTGGRGGGLYFPPHPGDESAMMGGLVATNAGGSRATKYGTIRTTSGDSSSSRPRRSPQARRQAREVEHRLQPHAPRHRHRRDARRRHQGRPPPGGQAGIMRSLVVPFEELEPALETVPLS